MVDITTVVHNKEEPYNVYIANPSKWANPFRNDDTLTRREKIDAYARWIVTQKHLMDDLHELEGKVLGCWCKPKPCHGDVLANLVNSSATKQKGLFNRAKVFNKSKHL